MYNELFSEGVHLVVGIAPVADFMSGTVNSDVVNLRDHEGCAFLIQTGAEATGTSLFTVEACSNVTPSATTAIPFWYRQNATNDTQGAVTRAAATGFTTTAGANNVIIIEVRAEDLAASGYKYVRLHGVEQANDPVTGGVGIILFNPRFKQVAHLRSEIV